MESKGTTVVASCIHQALTDSHRYTTLTDATLARENDPSQVAGTDAFKNKGFGALVQAARESQEVFETITADPYNLDKCLEVLAHMIVAAKDEQESK